MGIIKKIKNWILPTITEESVKNKLKFEYYKSSKNNKWYFRIRATNGKIIASSRQAYESKTDCISTIMLIKERVHSATIKDVTKNE